MIKFDHEGLLAAEFQGKLFEKSTELNCSTPIFIRRFLHSDLLRDLDDRRIVKTYSVIEGIDSILEQFGDTSYGATKYSKNSMFWMGYMYRYIAYTREESTKFVMKIFDYKLMNSLYYVYHTQDPEWCISNLLEMNHLTEDIFDKNYRLKQLIKAKENY